MLLENIAWLTTCLPSHAAFYRAARQPEKAQAAILAHLLRSNGASAYGRTCGFAKLRSVREFQDAVPIVSYDDLEPWIERIKNGEQRVLTSEPVLMLEKTSGSASAAKYIPYTSSLRAEFQRAIGAWMVDLYGHHPAMLLGSAYWCVTPLGREREITRGGLPVGFENDAEYFGRFARWLLGRVFVVPDEIARCPNLDACLNLTRQYLQRCASLAFISVWNPSFLTILVQGLNPRELWPKLQVISCWADAEARQAVPSLRKLFPNTTIQGKGLLATEGVVSIPLVGHQGAGLAVTSHFYEFLEDGCERPKLAHELEVGREYSVVMTNGGGLWRYRLGDRVRVTGFAGKLPLLELQGKEDSISDLCGEKLHAAFVGKILSDIYPASFAMLAPSAGLPRRYILFVEGDATSAETLDRRLRENPHYQYCRRLDQLAEVAVFRIRQGAHETYLRRCESLGQRGGNVKPTPLHKTPGWEEYFDGHWASAPREEPVIA